MGEESSNEDDAQHSADLKLALELLGGGATVEPSGLPADEYLKPGSPEELRAREALVRILLSERPLDQTLRRKLASVFNPRPPFLGRHVYARLTLGKKNSASTQRLALAEEVWRAKSKGSKIEAAVQEISEEYGVHENTVWNAWKQFSVFSDLWERYCAD
jgi:hypothetical protein